jgi:hypothetical protein
MPTMPKKPALQQMAETLAANLIDVLPSSVTSVPLGTTTMTPQKVASALQSGAATYTGVTTAKVAYSTAVKTRDDGEAPLRILVGQVVSFLKLVIGGDPAALAQCGIHAPKKKTPLTAEELAAQAAKNRATRISNGTTGAAQKRKAAKAAQSTTVVFGPDGQPLPGSTLPAGVTITSSSTTSAAPVANGASSAEGTPAAPAGVGAPAVSK